MQKGAIKEEQQRQYDVVELRDASVLPYRRLEKKNTQNHSRQRGARGCWSVFAGSH